LLLLRFIGVLAVIAVAVGTVLFLITGDRKYFRFALLLVKWAVIVALFLFGLIALERVMTLV
jgi:hypothetical protein